MLATVVVTLSFWAMAYGLAVGFAGTPEGIGGDPTEVSLAAVGLSLILVPVVFVIAALGSRRENWPIMVLAAMGLAPAVALPLLVFRNPLASLVAGYAAGAIVTLSRPAGLTWKWRAAAAAAVSLVAVVGLEYALTVAVFFVPALPFMAVGLIDLVTPQPEPSRTVVE